MSAHMSPELLLPRDNRTRPGLHSMPDFPDSMLGENLRRLAVRHKRDCDDECDVQLLLVLPVYEKLMGRRCTPEEALDFV